MNYTDTSSDRKPRCQKTGKTMFDKKGAQSKRNFLLKIGTERHLRIYQCPDCNNWHLTKT